MSLPRLYLKHFRKRAHNSFPLWEIGTDVSPADVGTFDDKLFSRLGNLNGKVPAELLEVERNHVPGQLQFSSSVDIDLGAGIGITPAPGTELNGEISFGRSGGVFFEAVDIVELRLLHLGDLLKHLEANDLIDRGSVVVGNVWTFASATLLVTETSDWSLSVSGKMPPVGVKLADASVNLSVKSGTGEKRTIPGKKSIHPMSVRVYGRRGWWSDRMTALDKQGGANMAEFVDVTAALDEDD